MSIIIEVSDHVLFEDDYILVVQKPASLMVEPDRNGHPNLLQQVQRYVKGNLLEREEVYAQHLHRLDRPVSGIVLFAKQKVVLRNLSNQFAERKVKKQYQAITEVAPKQAIGTLEHWHKKEKKRAVIKNEGGEWLEWVKLTYSTKPYDDRVLWDIELHTGKFHQIRAQLAHIGCPIIGDAMYGSSVLYKENQITLHACKLVFFHPITNEEMVVLSEPNWTF